MADKIAIVKFDGHWPEDMTPKYKLLDVCPYDLIKQYLDLLPPYGPSESYEEELSDLEEELNDDQLNLFE